MVKQLQKNRNWAIIAIILGNLIYLIPLIATISFCSMYGNWDKMAVAWVFSALCAIVYFVAIIIAIYDVVKDYNKKIKVLEEKMKDVDLQRRIGSLLKNGWSYGKLAKELGVSKTTIRRWHKGENKPKFFEYYQRINSLYFALYEPKETLICKRINTKKCKSWEEFEKEVFTDEYYNNAIAYHQKVIDDLKKSREAQKWKFTEDEKVILGNLSKNFKFIARDDDDNIWIYEKKPHKNISNPSSDKVWQDGGNFNDFIFYNHLFQCIQWSDTEPCEFRKFI